MPQPDPARDDTRDNAYVFERRVQFAHGDGTHSNGFIDLVLPGDEQELLLRLVALNAERAAEEARGVVGRLRPKF